MHAHLCVCVCLFLQPRVFLMDIYVECSVRVSPFLHTAAAG